MKIYNIKNIMNIFVAKWFKKLDYPFWLILSSNIFKYVVSVESI